jgi:cytochrome c-type biogenesis protein CcmH/NrfF
MMREEILLYITQIFKTETMVVLAVGALYGWLALNPEASRSYPLIWFLPPLLVLIGILHCAFLVSELTRIVSSINRRSGYR